MPLFNSSTEAKFGVTIHQRHISFFISEVFESTQYPSLRSLDIASMYPLEGEISLFIYRRGTIIVNLVTFLP